MDKVDAAVTELRASRLAPCALRLAPCPLSLAPGFTMVELLVAIALFAVLMSGVVMLFVGSVRSARTSYQQLDAFEKARSALTIVQNDLVTGFSSHQSSDLHTFYGTPIGMTFIGLVPSSTGSGDFNVARITYVVYNQPTDAMFPGVLEHKWKDINGTEHTDYLDAYPYPLLRFVEPDTPDLNTFPIPWDESFTVGTMSKSYRQALDELCGFPSDKRRPTDAERERIWAAMCEMWIRMLAGGDAGVPINYWDSPAWNLKKAVMNPLDYMVADNILSDMPPDRRQTEPFCGKEFFDYDLAAFFDNPNYQNPDMTKIANVWWNDPRSSRINQDDSASPAYGWQCGEEPLAPDAYSWNIRLPQVVTMSFWLMFESPYPGAPDFKRHFSLQINIPAAYARPQE
ncbi:MAG TPA: prepilin-type N-terminal cleavage/methylation domain-containing protein [Candidatus Hydrogenedentes bacterium]|nr:prepilin-type N-terminal cleavage/methylation domain-containing protein [Candidatus Hydrogenedentota bacterium]